jgi:DedD protein
MERKTKHRILGIVVMAALVIALLPLFHGSNNDIKPDQLAANAPPFPDQSTQVSDNSNPEFKLALANQVSPIPFKNQESDSGVNQQPDDTINTNTSKAYSNLNKQPVAPSTTTTPKATPAIAQPAEEEDDITSSNSLSDATKTVKSDDQPSTQQPDSTKDTANVFRNSLETELQAAAKPVAKKTAHPVKLHTPDIKMKQAQRKKVKLPLDDNGLFKLKSSAWVIQLGSYKNKASALRLVNRLRASGYNAFIQQASAETSVYVGPENKEAIARSIATRLESEMKIQGFVISYKPLTL